MTLSSERSAVSVVLRGAAASSLDVALFGDVRAGVDSLSDVRALSPRVAAQLQHEGEQVRRTAHADGFAAGYAEGHAHSAAELTRERDQLSAVSEREREQLSARVNAVLASLAADIALLPQRLTPSEDELGSAVLDAAFRLAEAVVAHDVAARADGVRTVLTRALALAPDGVDAIVRLAPADADTIGTLLADGARSVRLVADASIDRGGCVVESGSLRVDARLSAALARAKAVLEP
jgi:flagellar assembly protein FliH